MAIASNNLFPSLLVAEQVTGPETPDSGTQRIYMKSDHKLYHKGADGIEAEIMSGGSIPVVGRYRQWLYSAADGNLTILTDSIGNPLMGLCDLEV